MVCLKATTLPGLSKRCLSKFSKTVLAWASVGLQPNIQSADAPLMTMGVRHSVKDRTFVNILSILISSSSLIVMSCSKDRYYSDLWDIFVDERSAAAANKFSASLSFSSDWRTSIGSFGGAASGAAENLGIRRRA